MNEKQLRRWAYDVVKDLESQENRKGAYKAIMKRAKDCPYPAPVSIRRRFYKCGIPSREYSFDDVQFPEDCHDKSAEDWVDYVLRGELRYRRAMKEFLRGQPIDVAHRFFNYIVNKKQCYIRYSDRRKIINRFGSRIEDMRISDPLHINYASGPFCPLPLGWDTPGMGVFLARQCIVCGKEKSVVMKGGTPLSERYTNSLGSGYQSSREWRDYLVWDAEYINKYFDFDEFPPSRPTPKITTGYLCKDPHCHEVIGFMTKKEKQDELGVDYRRPTTRMLSKIPDKYQGAYVASSLLDYVARTIH